MSAAREYVRLKMEEAEPDDPVRWAGRVTVRLTAEQWFQLKRMAAHVDMTKTGFAEALVAGAITEAWDEFLRRVDPDLLEGLTHSLEAEQREQADFEEAVSNGLVEVR